MVAAVLASKLGLILPHESWHYEEWLDPSVLANFLTDASKALKNAGFVSKGYWEFDETGEWKPSSAPTDFELWAINQSVDIRIVDVTARVVDHNNNFCGISINWWDLANKYELDKTCDLLGVWLLIEKTL